LKKQIYKGRVYSTPELFIPCCYQFYLQSYTLISILPTWKFMMILFPDNQKENGYNKNEVPE